MRQDVMALRSRAWDGWIVVELDGAPVTSKHRQVGDETGGRGGEAAAISRLANPVTIDDVRVCLRRAGVVAGDTVIVHSSLSRLGWVVGGAQTIVAALLDVVGANGTVVMPAQTGMSDPAGWQHPPVPESWWPTIRASWPAFDAQLTPLRGMGAVAECFHRLPAVRHSGHPAHGFIAVGPQAATVTASHPLDDSFGEVSPLGRLYELDARIVLIGVGHDNNTSLHLAECRADWPGRRSKTDGAAVLVDGRRQWIRYTDVDYDECDFVELGEAFVEQGGVEGSATVGIGRITTYQMRELVDFATRWFSETRSSRTARRSADVAKGSSCTGHGV